MHACLRTYCTTIYILSVKVHLINRKYALQCAMYKYICTVGMYVNPVLTFFCFILGLQVVFLAVHPCCLLLVVPIPCIFVACLLPMPCIFVACCLLGWCSRYYALVVEDRSYICCHSNESCLATRWHTVICSWLLKLISLIS